ncbi:MAG TPA: MFS domain-containing histidine kinase [Anaerovoracaceae bacterium]|nr:MFS domain-containing histidine kinase [Anaerovoracaceae bacterium]
MMEAANYDTGYYGNLDEMLLYDSYQESSSFQREFEEKLNQILRLLGEYRSEEYIQSGASVSPERLEQATRDLFYSGSYAGDYGNGYAEVTIGRDTAATEYNIDYSEAYAAEESAASVYGNDYDAPLVRERFKEDYAEEIAKVKEILIQDDLRAFQDLKKELDQTFGFSYYATDGVNTVTSLTVSTGTSITAGQFAKAPAHLIYEEGVLKKVPASEKLLNRNLGYVDQSLEGRLYSQYNDALKVYFSFDDNYLAEKEEGYAAARTEFLKWFASTAVCALLSLIALIWLIAITGRKDETGTRPVHKIDRLFTELQLLIIAVFLVGGGAGFGSLLFETIRFGVYYNGGFYARGGLSGILSGLLAVAVGMCSAIAGLYFILSVVRNIKAGRFIKNSLIYIVLASLWRSVKTFYFGGSIMKKVVLVTLAICILSATVFFAPVAAILIIVFAPRWVKKYEDVKKGVEEVKNGNLSYKINASGEGELDELARGINEISEASSIAIQNELKNQRLKTDLISNVSHDLKTPLTSIITYIDLLKQEGLDSPDAPKYLEILDQKSIRLKKLTEDLFDAAKASSGAIPVKVEKVDVLSLINQGLGEMDDRIQASNLEFRINALKEKYYVRADGQLLWRVVENLLSNVLKYAQEGSRVYIDLREQNGKSGKLPNVILEIKNISKTELNIDADELMERFKRGDESRSTEGSGLGLAIAKDLVRLQNGWFEIKIDGDLFKAVVLLEAYAPDKNEMPPA